ncbi:CopD family protein, partial [Beggiatoa alba]|nr:CopD family protein [Beggiatoa alba]
PVAASQLEPPVRLKLWTGVFSRFFPIVWIAVALLPATGYPMVFSFYQGFEQAPKYIHIMNGLGLIMLLIYMHVFFAPYKRLKQAVASENWPEGGKKLNQIRILVGINTIIGLVVITVAAAGRYL